MAGLASSSCLFSVADGAKEVEWVSSKSRQRATCLGYLDAPGGDALGGAVMGVDWSLTYPTGGLPGLVSGETLLVGGRSFRVREVVPDGDGDVSVASLSEVKS